MLKKAPLECAINEVLMEDGEFALIFRPHPREFAISRGEKSANARGSGPDGGGGGGEGGALGAASIDQCIIPPRSWTSKPGQNLLFKIKRFKMRTGNKIQAWPVHLPKTPCAPCFLRRCLYRHRNDPHHRNDPRHRNDPQSPPK